jgi:hypothetical protein
MRLRLTAIERGGGRNDGERAGSECHGETIVRLDRRLPIAQASKPTAAAEGCAGVPPRGVKSLRANPKL